MLKELFELWTAKVEEAKTVKVKEYDRFKDRIVVAPDGAYQEFPADAPRRRHTASSIAALHEFVADRFSADKLSVWYSRDGVTVVLDEDDDRANTIRLSLSFSPQILRLCEMAKHRKQISQKETISLLRIEFRECGLGNLADVLRNVKFQINTEGGSELQKTKVSVGKSTLAAFHGLENLVDEIAFVVPVFDGKFDVREAVNVAIEPDPQTQTFQLIPFPGEIEAAIQRAEKRLGEALREKFPEQVPVIFGTP